jgi:hypothetical protein
VANWGTSFILRLLPKYHSRTLVRRRRWPPVFAAETPLTNSTQRNDSNCHSSNRSGTDEFFAALLQHPFKQEEPMAAAKKAKKTARGRKQDRARVAGGQDYEVR